MFSLNAFQKQYQTDATDVVVAEQKFHLLVPRCIERFIDPRDPLRNFPLWSKIWLSSLILADYLARQPVDPAKRFLEIGAGVGLVSIVAARRGHVFTLTEHDPHALDFARANAQLNKCYELDIRSLDWCAPDLEESFDYIVGSEVLYDQRVFPPLSKLFKNVLRPDGTVILAGETRKTDMAFYKVMQPHFHIRIEKRGLRSEKENTRINLFKMTLK
ncbi:MAG: methyltransferase [Desulfobacterales bacterium]|jgi:predicted nicotinamide N-methyase